jgi:phage gp29-like protein
MAPRDISSELSSAKGFRADVTDRISDLFTLRTHDEILLTQGRGDLIIYERLFNDAQIKSCWEQRRNALLASETTVAPGGDKPIDLLAASFIDKQLKAIEWDHVCADMLLSRFYGFAVAELLFKPQRVTPQIAEKYAFADYEYSPNGDSRRWIVELTGIATRNSRRFKYDPDHNLRLLTKDEPYRGIAVPTNKFWTVRSGSYNSDEPLGRGLGAVLYWLRFFKVNLYNFWMVHLEKYAAPSSIIEYDAALAPGEKGSPAHAQYVAELAQMAADAIAHSGTAISKDLTLRLLEAGRSGAAGYEELMHRIDSEISKAILSQTMTTDNGGSFAQAKVHDAVVFDAFKADADDICGSANRTWVKQLIEWNFPGAALPEIWRVVRPEPDLSLVAARDKILTVDMGMQLSKKYLRETYGDIFLTEADAEEDQGPLNLNAEQNKVLVQMINDAKAGDWSVELAEAFIRSTFPTVPAALIDALKKDLTATVALKKPIRKEIAAPVTTSPVSVAIPT